MGVGDSHDVPKFDNSAVWFTRFKEPVTRIRIMPWEADKEVKVGRTKKVVRAYGSDAWPTELEHSGAGRSYDGKFLSWACPAPYGEECGGCTDPDPKVSKRTRTHYFNGIDDQGRVRAYKIGSMLYKTLHDREGAYPDGGFKAQSLTKKDHLIHKTGSLLLTRYDPEGLDPFEIDFSNLEYMDIKAMLNDGVKEARAYYAEQFPSDGIDAEMPTGFYPGLPAADPVVNDTAVTTTGVTTKVEAGYQFDAPWGNTPDAAEIGESDTATIKLFLDSRGIKYASRAARPDLIIMAVEANKIPF